MELEGSSLPQSSNLYKIINLRDRNPGATETFFFRYVGVDESGNRIVSNRSAAIIFDNNGLTTYTQAPTITVVPQIQAYTVSWPVPDQSVYPNYLKTEVYESKTLSTPETFNVASLTGPDVVYQGESNSNSKYVPTASNYDLRYVRVRHVGLSAGQLIYSPLSNIVSVTPESADPTDTTPPAPPTGFAVTAYNDQTDRSGQNGYVIFTWTPPGDSDLFGYYVRYGTSASTLDTYVFYAAGTTSGRIDNLRAGVTYYFQISSTDANNPNTYIPETPISATIPGDTTAPSAPSGLVAVAGFNNIIAYWNRNSEDDVDLGRGTYQFQLDDSSDFSSILQDRTITGTVASFTGLTTGTTYYIRVRAIDSSGNAGAWSSSASATPGKINAELAITSGTIVGDLVAANTIVGDKLVANSIDADRFKTNTGIVGKLFVGDDAGNDKITIDGTATIPAVYYGTGVYNSSDTPFYFDANGRFSLKDQLSWNGASLSVKGSLNVTQLSTFSSNVLIDGGSIVVGTAVDAAQRVTLANTGIFGYYGGSEKFSLNMATGKGKLTFGNMVVGDDAGGLDNDGIYINATNYIYDTGYFSLAGGKVTWNGTQLNVTGNISGSSFSTTNNIIKINNNDDNKITFSPPGLTSGVLEIKDYLSSGLGYLYMGAPYNTTYGLQPFLEMKSLSDTPNVTLSSVTGSTDILGNIVRLGGSVTLGYNSPGGTTTVSSGTLEINYSGLVSQINSRIVTVGTQGIIRKGRAITHSSSAPSGGEDGDIHFQL